jgi:hypothetical protein
MARDREVRDLRQNLLARVQDAAIQQERSRLARELHDSIKQQIFGISFGAAAAQARRESDPQGARQAIDDVRCSAQEARTCAKQGFPGWAGRGPGPDRGAVLPALRAPAGPFCCWLAGWLQNVRPGVGNCGRSASRWHIEL